MTRQTQAPSTLESEIEAVTLRAEARRNAARALAGLTPRDARLVLVEHVATHPRASVHERAQELYGNHDDVATKRVRSLLSALVRRGIIERTRSGELKLSARYLERQPSAGGSRNGAPPRPQVVS